MKTLILPDIHDRLDRVQAILIQEQPDSVVSLGDWFDSWTGNEHNARATAEFLKTQTKDWTLILGNHDLSYGWDNKCSGWEAHKQRVINSIMKHRDWRRFVPSAWVGPYLCTHAGVHQRLWADAEDFERAMTYLKNDLDSDIGKSVYSIWLGAGFERGGDQRYGGLVWCDWAKLDPPQGLKQICGHTPAKTVRFKHGSDVVCLDTALKDYAIWDGENLEVKHFGRTTTDAKTD